MMARTGAKREAPSAGLSGYTLAVLVAAYAVSFVDRQVLGLLVEPIRTDLALDDTHIGLLQGPAFGLFYALLGMPIGWLADRVHRVRLMVAGVLLWSLATTGCGLADDFTTLFLARVCVGVGEATLVPAAVSLLADLFVAKRRALAMSVFTAGISLGAGLALLLGGWFVAFARDGAASLPVIGAWLSTMHPWQIVFVLAGSLGLPVAAAMAFITEPVRGGAAQRVLAGKSLVGDGPAVGGSPAVGDSVQDMAAPAGLAAYLRVEWRLFAPLLVGSSLLYLFSNAMAGWMPTLFIRGFGWTPAQAGLRLGGLLLVCALAGNLLSGTVATWLAGRGRIDAPLLTMWGGAALLVPAALTGPLAGTAGLAQAGIVAIYFAIALCFGVATASFVAVTPAALRGRMIALYLLCGNLVGLGLGPPAVGLLLDHVVGDRRHVGLALALVGLCSVVPGAMLILLVRPAYAVQAGRISRFANESDGPGD